MRAAWREGHTRRPAQLGRHARGWQDQHQIFVCASIPMKLLDGGGREGPCR